MVETEMDPLKWRKQCHKACVRDLTPSSETANLGSLLDRSPTLPRSSFSTLVSLPEQRVRSRLSSVEGLMSLQDGSDTGELMLRSESVSTEFRNIRFFRGMLA
ncbi:hypothetical protein DPEC_G00305470 [Dallia pectoralis]|uniref:Uncharacterized protein n=1 Tax=Dallia pectoralis TaxID=75939 RepID=A0ACC2FDW5_DALPE|nr:hypothetical protein DPEC_G00305470 [Dallia pectoralis]